MTDYLAAATAAAVPEIAAIDRAVAYLRTVRFPAASSITDVQGDLLERIIAGDRPTGKAMVEELAAAQMSLHPITAAQNMAANASRDLAHRVQQLRAHRADDILAWLDTRLADLVDTARPTLATLTGVETAAQAIAAGPDAVTAWPKLEQLISDYNGLRHAQQAATVAGYGQDAAQSQQAVKDIARFGIVRGSRHFPPLANQAAAEAPTLHVERIGERYVLPDTPWPADDPIGTLRWCIDAQPVVAGGDAVRVWIPTCTELRAEAASQHDAAGSAELDARYAAANIHRPQAGKRYGTAGDQQIAQAQQLSEVKAHRIPGHSPAVYANGTSVGADPAYNPTA